MRKKDIFRLTFEEFENKLAKAKQDIQVLEKLNDKLERDVLVKQAIIDEYREIVMQCFHERG
jgi:hypothetical protein